MNGHQLYKHILRAAQAFGLPFYEIELIKVDVSQNEITFSFQDRKMIVTI